MSVLRAGSPRGSRQPSATAHHSKPATRGWDRQPCKGRLEGAPEDLAVAAPPPRRILLDRTSRAARLVVTMSSVCEQCFEDDALKRVVTQNKAEDDCTFCGATGTDIAAPIETVVEHIRDCLRGEYDDALNVLFYDNEDRWGFAGATWDTEELLRDELELGLAKDDGDLFDALAEGLGRDIRWSVADPALLAEHDELRVHWDVFCQRIKHRGPLLLALEP